MADYRDHYPEIRAGGADVVAVSVDRPEQSERLRRELALPFTILSDADRRVVKEWDIFNPREHGGIAKPAIFVIEADRSVAFASVDSVRKRVPAAKIAEMLHTRSFDGGAQRASNAPRLHDFMRALRNTFSR